MLLILFGPCLGGLPQVRLRFSSFLGHVDWHTVLPVPLPYQKAGAVRGWGEVGSHMWGLFSGQARLQTMPSEENLQVKPKLIDGPFWPFLRQEIALPFRGGLSWTFCVHPCFLRGNHASVSLGTVSFIRVPSALPSDSRRDTCCYGPVSCGQPHSSPLPGVPLQHRVWPSTPRVLS